MSDKLPPGWIIAPVAQLTPNPKHDIVSGPFGSNLKSDEYVPEGIPIIRLQNVDRNEFVEKNMRFITPEKARDLTAHTFNAGDIVITKLGDPLGKACIVPGKLSYGIVVADVVRVRIDERRFCKRYVVFAINSPSVASQINQEMKGSTRPRVNLNHLRDLQLPLAPINEQRRIVAKLEELLAKVNACRKRLDKIPRLLKRFRQAVLSAACSGRLTTDWREDNSHIQDAEALVTRLEKAHLDAGGHKRGNAAPPSDEAHDLSAEDLPGTWRIIEFRTAVLPGRPITYGILKPGPDIPDGVPYVRVADFPNDCLNLCTVRHTSKEIENSYARARLQPGDILLSIRGTVGRVTRVPAELENANITQDTARLSIQPSLDSNFVMWFLRAPATQKRMRNAVKGVAVRGINIGDVRALQLAIPPLPEQREIVRRTEELQSLADQIEARYQKAKAHVDKLTQSILAKAFCGELVPQDPNDEPAEKLLERIRQERGGTANTRPQTRKSRERL